MKRLSVIAGNKELTTTQQQILLSQLCEGIQLCDICAGQNNAGGLGITVGAVFRHAALNNGFKTAMKKAQEIGVEVLRDQLMSKARQQLDGTAAIEKTDLELLKLLLNETKPTKREAVSSKRRTSKLAHGDNKGASAGLGAALGDVLDVEPVGDR